MWSSRQDSRVHSGLCNVPVNVLPSLTGPVTSELLCWGPDFQDMSLWGTNYICPTFNFQKQSTSFQMNGLENIKIEILTMIQLLSETGNAVLQNKMSPNIIAVVVWRQRTLMGSYIWMLDPQLVQLFEKDKELWPCWRRNVTGFSGSSLSLPCACGSVCELSAPTPLLLLRVLSSAMVPAMTYHGFTLCCLQ